MSPPPPTRLATGLLTVALALLAALPALSQSDQDGLGIRLLEVPADRADDPRARAYVVDHVPPATTIERRFEVVNGSGDPADVDLYAASASIEGDAFVPAAGRDTNDLASWISVEPSTVRMQPRGRLTATMRIEVPADAEPGERYAVVLAERAAPEQVPVGEVGVAARVGLRVYLSVGPGAEPPTDFEVTTFTALTREDGVRVVRVGVANTGGRALDFAGELTLSEGPGGLSIGEPYEVTPGTTLAVDEDVELDVELDDQIPGGPWRAELLLTSGSIERRASAELEFPDEPGVAGEPELVAEAEPGPPWALLTGLLVVVGGIVAVAVWVRLGRPRFWAGSAGSIGSVGGEDAGGPAPEPPGGTDAWAPPDGAPSAGGHTPPPSRSGSWAPPSAAAQVAAPPPAPAGPRPAPRAPAPPPPPPD